MISIEVQYKINFNLFLSIIIIGNQSNSRQIQTNPIQASILAISSMSTKHDSNYYLKCMIGGLLACGITHTVIVPLDVSKIKKQIDTKFSKGLFDGVKKVFRSGQFTLGWAPTFIGHSLQGLCRFGFYQIFKDIYKDIFGDQNAKKYRKTRWVIASGFAQLIGTVFLCPFQLLRIRIMLSRPGFQYPNQIMSTFKKIQAEEGNSVFYRHLVKLWFRQVPFNIVKFVVFELLMQFFYANLLTKQKYDKVTQLSINFVSGYLAGAFSSFNSCSAEYLTIYRFNKSVVDFKSLRRSSIHRIINAGTISGFQWLIYESFKTSLVFTTSGGSKQY